MRDFLRETMRAYHINDLTAAQPYALLSEDPFSLVIIDKPNKSSFRQLGNLLAQNIALEA